MLTRLGESYVNGHSEKVAEELGFDKDPKTKRPSDVRLLLDTNVWRYIADQKAWSEIQRVSKLHSTRILISPSVLYEALRTGDPQLRRSLSRVMTLQSWTRLMPEAFSEIQEMISEIRRLRPEWLRPRRDVEFIRQRYDWSRRRGGFWDRARANPDTMAQHISVGNDDLSNARMEAQFRREDFRAVPRFEAQPLDSLFYTPVGYRPAGWEGDRIEAWRLQVWGAMSNALDKLDHPYREWLSYEVDVDKILLNGSSWVRFWFYDVKSEALPRAWLRWAFEFLLAFRRLTDGTPCDIQLAAYLPEADVVISADKAFIQITERCRRFAPCHMPEPILVPGGAKAVDAVLTRIAQSTPKL